VIVELREKVAGELSEGLPAVVVGTGDDPRALAREGLVNLGYTAVEAEGLLESASGETPEELIGTALRSAGSGGS
jgi:holliday junction DNA helicase RuvA